jgi:hypothetical protein
LKLIGIAAEVSAGRARESVLKKQLLSTAATHSQANCVKKKAFFNSISVVAK